MLSVIYELVDTWNVLVFRQSCVSAIHVIGRCRCLGWNTLGVSFRHCFLLPVQHLPIECAVYTICRTYVLVKSPLYVSPSLGVFPPKNSVLSRDPPASL